MPKSHPANSDHHSLVAHVRKTRDNSVHTITDVLSFSKWMENPLYRNCRHRLRLRYSLAFNFSNDPGTHYKTNAKDKNQ